MINFSNRLKELLNKKNISIKDFAKKVGMSEIGLHNAIKNNSTKLETIDKIAKVLKITPSYFFKTDEELLSDSKIKQHSENIETIVTLKSLVLNALYNGVERWRFFSAWEIEKNGIIDERIWDEFDNEIIHLKSKSQIVDELIEKYTGKKLYDEILKLVPINEVDSFKKINKSNEIHLPAVECLEVVVKTKKSNKK